MHRSWQHCPHRCNCIAGELESGFACDLLGTISGVQLSPLLRVTQAECTACCESFRPTADDWNPVIISLLCRLSEEVIAADGVNGMTVIDAQQLQEAALQSLPLVLPDEDDCIDDLQQTRKSVSVSLHDLQQQIPLPSPSTPTVPRNWAVGISTAPRRQSTLATTASSLRRSGWEEFHLFVDGQVELTAELEQAPQSRRSEPSGAWPAWCWALETLLQEYPAADLLMLVQDDTLFPEVACLRGYVELLMGCRSQPQLVSLYTSTEDMQTVNAWRAFPGVWRYGALAVVLTRAAAERLRRDIQDQHLEIEGNAAIDLRLGIWADRTGNRLWHPSPSLVQHIGQVSSIWRRARAVGLRRASRFLADELSWDAPSLGDPDIDKGPWR